MENRVAFQGNEWASVQVQKGGYIPLGTQESEDWGCVLKCTYF